MFEVCYLFILLESQHCKNFVVRDLKFMSVDQACLFKTLLTDRTCHVHNSLNQVVKYRLGTGYYDD